MPELPFLFNHIWNLSLSASQIPVFGGRLLRLSVSFRRKSRSRIHCHLSCLLHAMDYSTIAISTLPNADNDFSKASTDLMGFSVLLMIQGESPNISKSFSRSPTESLIQVSVVGCPGKVCTSIHRRCVVEYLRSDMTILNDLPMLFTRHQPRCNAWRRGRLRIPEVAIEALIERLLAFFWILCGLEKELASSKTRY